MRRLVALLGVLATVVSACASSGDERVVLAAGTTVVDSGLMELLVDSYKSGGGPGEIDVIGLSSQQSFAYAAASNADITITHEEALLAAFLSETPDAVSSPVFTSRFLYVGAPSLNFAAHSVASILETVATEGTTFVSRDDGSGTHVREVEMWNAVGVDPSGEAWYIRTGTGMGETLLVTDQRGGVTLSEQGAYLAAADAITLVQIDDGSDARLVNPYDATIVDPPANNAAVEFFAWLTSEAGGAAIIEANDALFGTQVYLLP